MKFAVCGATVTGPGHLARKEENQDALLLRGWKGGWIASVADGLGSRPHSGHGAACACRVAREVLCKAKSTLDVQQAIPTIHARWLRAIQPKSPSDAATTLLFARVTSGGRVDTAQLGDGLLMIRQNGRLQIITKERGGYGNQTWALEERYDPRQWVSSSYKLVRPGDGVILMTDGIADDLNLSSLPQFFDAIYGEVKGRNRRMGKRWLESELLNWATPLHSDDKTLAAVFRVQE